MTNDQKAFFLSFKNFLLHLIVWLLIFRTRMSQQNRKIINIPGIISLKMKVTTRAESLKSNQEKNLFSDTLLQAERQNAYVCLLCMTSCCYITSFYLLALH